MSRSPRDARYPLELSGEEFCELVNEAASFLARFLDSLPQQPAARLEGSAEMARAVIEPIPENGRPFDSLLEQLFDRVFNIALNTTGPGYLGYIPGGGIPQAAIADLLVLVTNRYPGLWSAAPVVATIESTVIRWFCDLVGFGAESGGFLTSGGSLANWTALVAARDLRAPNDFRHATIYTSNQAHHSVAKAALMAGFDRAHVRQIAVDEQFRVCIDALRESIAADRTSGLIPLAVIAHAGTTNTGAVDDLPALASISKRENMWLHVDAAYGGFFMLTVRGRAVLRGLEHADSITLDPHKGLFLPYGTGCLLVRECAPLRQVFGMRGDYMTMTAAAGSPEFVDFCDISPELSRDFRGLRIWLPIQMHGALPFRQALDEKLDLARHVETELACIDGIEIMAHSPLTVIPFRLVKPGLSETELNDLNREFLTRINSSRRVLLTSTVLGGRFVIRMCILSFRTHRDRIDECLTLIRVAASNLTGQSRQLAEVARDRSLNGDQTENIDNREPPSIE